MLASDSLRASCSSSMVSCIPWMVLSISSVASADVAALGLAALLAAVLRLLTRLAQLVPLVDPLPPVAHRRDRAARQLLDDLAPLRAELVQQPDDQLVLLRLPRAHVLVDAARHGAKPGLRSTSADSIFCSAIFDG